MVVNIHGGMTLRTQLERISTPEWNDFRDVGYLPKGRSPYGLFDMAGNGWESVSSAYLPYPYAPHLLPCQVFTAISWHHKDMASRHCLPIPNRCLPYRTIRRGFDLWGNYRHRGNHSIRR